MKFSYSFVQYMEYTIENICKVIKVIVYKIVLKYFRIFFIINKFTIEFFSFLCNLSNYNLLVYC